MVQNSWEDLRPLFWPFLFLVFVTIIVVICVLTTGSNETPVVSITSETVPKISKAFNEMSSNELMKLVHHALPLKIDWLQASSPVFHKLVQEDAFSVSEIVVDMDDTSIVSDFIDEIVFINLADSTQRKAQIEDEIQEIIEPNIIVKRFEAIRKEEGALGCGLSHLQVILYAALSHKNVLILEDDFQFNDSRQDIIAKLGHVQESFPQSRWDVIVFGQYTKAWSNVSNGVMRLLESTTTSGYLVNKDYAETLYRALLEHMVPLLDKTPFEHEDHIDQFQLGLQQQHVWVGFQNAIGKQRPVHSIIGNVFSNNSWTASSDLKHWFHGDDVTPYQLVTHPDFKLLRIALCMVATGRYIQFVESIAQDATKLFCRPHYLHMFLFTDSDQEFPNVSKYFTPRTGFPGDTIHRYDYMLKAERELQAFDYIFYVDVDYRILEYVPLDSLFPTQQPGIAVTTHLFGLQKEYENQNHVGTPDANPKSSACIFPDEKMISYFAGGFQGGTREAFLTMCRQIASNVKMDERNDVMALWHDESHLNRYCVTNKPLSILSQSFIYPEHCLDPENTNRTCKDLRTHNIRPIMVPLDKDHKQVRSV